MSVKLIAVLLLVAALTANFSPILVNSINAQNLNVKVSGIGNTTNSSLGGNTMGTGNMSNPLITNNNIVKLKNYNLVMNITDQNRVGF